MGIGFRAKLSVNDGAANAEAFFANAVSVKMPDADWGEYEEKILHTDSKDRKFLPTLRDNGTLVAKSKFTKAEYVRLKALEGVTDKTWKVYEPADSGDPPLLATIDGWVKKVADVMFEKDIPVEVTFELRVNTVTMAS